MGSDINPFDSQETKPSVGEMPRFLWSLGGARRADGDIMQVQERSADHCYDGSCLGLSDEGRVAS